MCVLRCRFGGLWSDWVRLVDWTRIFGLQSQDLYSQVPAVRCCAKLNLLASNNVVSIYVEDVKETIWSLQELTEKSRVSVNAGSRID